VHAIRQQYRYRGCHDPNALPATKKAFGHIALLVGQQLAHAGAVKAVDKGVA